MQLRNVLPLTLQQHGTDVVLALQQQKGVHITTEHAEKSEASRTKQARQKKNKKYIEDGYSDTVAQLTKQFRLYYTLVVHTGPTVDLCLSLFPPRGVMFVGV